MPKNKTLNLIYRGSKNDFSATNFHSICDNQSGIITVIQSDSGRIFGGFQTIPRTSKSGWFKDSKAFLFSVSDKAKF